MQGMGVSRVGGTWGVILVGVLAAGVCWVGWGWSAQPKAGSPEAGGAAQTASEPSASARPADVQVLIVYYSLRGSTEKMASAVAEGARSVPGVQVKLKKVEEVTKEELTEADGLILGCPTYFANIPGKMKVLMDDWNWKWKVDFTDKVGGAFATGGGLTGGKEFVITSLLLFMINHRMIVAGPLYEDEQGEDKWGELGASAATGPLDPGLSEAELFTARRLGQRIAQLAKKLHPRQ